MIYSGNLTEQLAIYRPKEIQSASGEHQLTEVYQFTCRAQKMKDKGYYVMDASELFHIDRPQFKIRKRDVVETDVVVWRGSRYRITNIDLFRSDMTLSIEKIND